MPRREDLHRINEKIRDVVNVRVVGEGIEQGFIVLAVFLGVGVPAVKSALLSSVSVHPFDSRMAAVVLLTAGVGPVPSKQLAVVL